jgi:hypothetical protein
MSGVVHQRCYNHAAREAAARCPSCKRFFCRECITEHEDRVICAACLRKLSLERTAERRSFAGVITTAQVLGGVLTVWFFFFLVGEALVRLPAAFHESELWRGTWIER